MAVSEKFKNEAILVSRILIISLFVMFRWKKMIGFSGAVGYTTSVGTPIPEFSALIAVFMELFVAIAVRVDTRALALLVMVYTNRRKG
ncbi:MAG: DoxX family protein [Acidocella sp.]|nr:DoxX family protein [Acidocella sp.]